jgi:outer membrane immunogenic protein
MRSDSGYVGLHGGYQQQFGAIVLGVEAAGSISRTNWASENGFSILPTPFASESRLKNLITVGPRLGYAYSSLLFYGTGGWAHADIDTRATLNGAIPIFDAGNSHNGWFAGGGVELLVGKNAFIGVEYKHVALDTERHCIVGGACAAIAIDRDVSADADIVTARLSLKWGFDDRVAPLK